MKHTHNLHKAALFFIFININSIQVFCEPLLVTESLKRMDAVKMEDFAYTMTRSEKDKTTVESYDPLFPVEPKWLLMLKNGLPPSDKEQKEYKSKKLKEQKDQQQGMQGNGKKPNSLSFKEYIDTNSLQLTTETESTCIYSFNISNNSENPFGKFSKNISGILQINKLNNYVEYISIASSAPFSPYLGVEVKQFKMEMRFNPVQDKVLMQESRFLIKGSAFLMAKFDTDVVSSYDNYVYRGR